MHQRVGLQRDEGVDVVGGGQPEFPPESADFADVAAHLLRAVHPDADQFEQGVLDDLGDDHPADESRTPDNNALCLRFLHGLHHRRARDHR